MRADHGQELKPEDGTYTWAELSVDPAKVLASQKAKSLVKGDEFNAYLKINKSAVDQFGKRGRSLAEAREDIVRLMAAGRLLAEECKKNKEQFSDIEIERTVSNLVRDNMIDEEFDMKNSAAETISDYMEILNRRSIAKNKAKSDNLRSVLKDDAQCAENDYDVRASAMHAAYSHAQAMIGNSIKDNEIYDWMKAKGFKGAPTEAHFAMTQERHKKHIDDLIASEKVVFSVQ
jgi:hypothetical protein